MSLVPGSSPASPCRAGHCESPARGAKCALAAYITNGELWSRHPRATSSEQPRTVMLAPLKPCLNRSTGRRSGWLLGCSTTFRKQRTPRRKRRSKPGGGFGMSGGTWLIRLCTQAVCAHHRTPTTGMRTAAADHGFDPANRD